MIGKIDLLDREKSGIVEKDYFQNYNFSFKTKEIRYP